MQQPNRLIATLQIVERAIQWLKTLLWLTDEEQKAAGISYPDQQRYG